MGTINGIGNMEETEEIKRRRREREIEIEADAELALEREGASFSNPEPTTSLYNNDLMRSDTLPSVGAPISPEVAEGTASFVDENKEMVLPLAGTAIGAAATGGQSLPIQALVAALGSLGGRKLNQALDISPDSGIIEDVAQTGAETGLNLIGGKVGQFIGGKMSPSLRAGKAAMADELAGYVNSSREALQYAENAPQGPMMRRSADDIQTRQTITKNEGEAVQQAFRAANDPRAMGAELGIPRSTASNAALAQEEALLTKASDIYDTKIYERHGRINPYSKDGEVAKFEGSGDPTDVHLGLRLKGPRNPATTEATILQIKQAKLDLMDARRQSVDTLDRAMQTYNDPVKVAQGGREPIQGIRYSTDIAPKLQGIRKLIADRKMLIQTEPAANEMQAQLTQVEQSMDRIISQTDNRSWVPAYPGARQETGELTISQANTLLEDAYAARRAMHEFDAAIRAKGIAGQASDPTGYGAALTALDDISAAFRQSLEAKASEVVSKAKTIDGFYDWSQHIQLLDEKSIARMNRTYSALDPLQDALKVQYDTTAAMMKRDEPGRLITSINQQAGKGAFPITSPKQGASRIIDEKAGEMIGKFRDTPPPGLEIAQAVEARDVVPMNNLRLMSIMRGQTPPPLPRQWSAGRTLDPMEVAYRMMGMGLIQAPVQYASASEPERKMMYNQLLAMDPGSMPASYGFKSLMDDKFADPMEASAYMQMVKDNPSLDGTRKQEILAAASQSKFIPMDSQPVELKPTIEPNIAGALNNIIPFPTDRVGQPTASTDADRMIEQMNASMGMRDTTRSGM